MGTLALGSDSCGTAQPGCLGGPITVGATGRWLPTRPSGGGVVPHRPAASSSLTQQSTGAWPRLTTKRRALSPRHAQPCRPAATPRALVAHWTLPETMSRLGRRRAYARDQARPPSEHAAASAAHRLAPLPVPAAFRYSLMVARERASSKSARLASSPGWYASGTFDDRIAHTSSLERSSPIVCTAAAANDVQTGTPQRSAA